MELEKAAALYDFMFKWRLLAANTFAEETTRELLNTRHNWGTEFGGDQIDFILVSRCRLFEAHVDQHLQADTDHRAVEAEIKPWRRTGVTAEKRSCLPPISKTHHFCR